MLEREQISEQVTSIVASNTMEMKFAERSDCIFAAIRADRAWKRSKVVPLHACESQNPLFGDNFVEHMADLKSVYFGDLRRISITRLISELYFLFVNDFSYY